MICRLQKKCWRIFFRINILWNAISIVLSNDLRAMWKTTSTFFVGLRKAFDAVDHKILLKIDFQGIRNRTTTLNMLHISPFFFKKIMSYLLMIQTFSVVAMIRTTPVQSSICLIHCDGSSMHSYLSSLKRQVHIFFRDAFNHCGNHSESNYSLQETF